MTLALHLRSTVSVVDTHGIRVFTPAAFTHRLPGIARILQLAERGVRSRTPLRNFGGFFVIEAARRG